MTGLTPQQAQKRVEERWRRRSVGKMPLEFQCSWCVWSDDFCFSRCPVTVVFGKRCLDLPVYRDWENKELVSSPGLDEDLMLAARAVFDLLVKHRDKLIKAAYGILETLIIEESMTDLTPEQAQAASEEMWRRRSEGIPIPEEASRCDWCIWSDEQCHARCPVPDVFGERCQRLRVYDDWCLTAGDSESERLAAQIILDLLIKHRDELTKAARKIEEGADD